MEYSDEDDIAQVDAEDSDPDVAAQSSESEAEHLNIDVGEEEHEGHSPISYYVTPPRTIEHPIKHWYTYDTNTIRYSYALIGRKAYVHGSTNQSAAVVHATLRTSRGAYVHGSTNQSIAIAYVTLRTSRGVRTLLDQSEHGYSVRHRVYVRFSTNQSTIF